MKKSHMKFIIGLLSFSFLASSCIEEDKRVVYPHSTPVIESSTVAPANLMYGDSILITAKVSDPTTPLSTLEMAVLVGDNLIGTKSIRTKGQNAEVSEKVATTFAKGLANNAKIDVVFKLINVEGDVTEKIVNVAGKRHYFTKLHLVLDNGNVIELKPQAVNSDKYLSAEIKIKSKSIKYKIAEKIDADKQIDYSGKVWGAVDKAVQIIDEDGDYIETTNDEIDFITKIQFDAFAFATTLVGEKLDPNTIYFDDFGDATVGGQDFKHINRTLTKDQILTLDETFASNDIVFQMEYFTRTAVDKLKYTGETGQFDLYYHPTRKHVILYLAQNNEFPDVLLANGEGLGYPSKVAPAMHTGWNFDTMLSYIPFRKIADNVYQGTVYMDAGNANFKFFETKGWANEKLSDDYTLPTLLMKSADKNPGEKPNGNWYASSTAKSGNYKITVNLATKTVTAEAVTFP